MPVKGAEAFFEAFGVALNIPRVELCAHAGSFDGHVGDARVFQQLNGALQTVLCFGFTQNCFAQEVEVELEAFFLRLIQQVVQCFAFCVKHQVSHHLPKPFAGQRHYHVGELPRHECTCGNQAAVD